MIHYHGTPCSGTKENAATFLAGRHAMVSFAAPDDIGIAAEVCHTFCLDNGAFSAWIKGEPVTDWRPYYEWVQTWRQHPAFAWAVIPDAIDGSEDDNDALVCEWWKAGLDGHCGVPVWHLHESTDRLDKLLAQWHRVALGSSGEWPNPGTERWWERMAEAMEVACGTNRRPRRKLHGLRMLDPAIFSRLPLASADSTNAVRNASSLGRFGQYVPPNASTRMSIIAERIERHQSAAVWQPLAEQGRLVFMGTEQVA